MLTEENLLKIFRESRLSALDWNELKKILKIHPHQMSLLRRLVRRMVDEEQLVKLKKGLFAIPVTSGLITGILEMNPRGFGFVRPLENVDDIYIHRENIATAMDRDRVLVSLIPGDHEGRIVRVLERANHEVVGTLEKSKKIFFVIPDNSKLVYDIIVPNHALQGAHPKDKVVVKLTRWPSKHLNPQGIVIEVLGKSTDPKLDSISIAKNYAFPFQFPKKVEKEAQQWTETIPLSEISSRWDLTDLLAFTIDPVDARDFDDAISIEVTDQGWLLGIHIADVSFYVPQDSNIDQEALLRGCTVYFTDRAIRMLPEKLSREICSLDEGKKRLAKSIFVEFNQEGEILNWKIGKSVICSKKRFSYEEVTQLLIDSSHPHPDLGVSIRDCLFQLEKLTKILFLKRLERGALELDIPEVEIIQDSRGHVLNLKIHPKEISHRLVEECMLMANYLVARLIVEKKLPGVFRIHEKPSEVDQDELKRFVRALGIPLKSKLTSKSLQTLVETFKGKPLSSVVNLALLRSLKVAQYSPKNVGHFALALDFYTHFTSPIRRYPDLCVHQILDHHLFSPEMPFKKDLSKIARHCSEVERKADKAEQEFNNLKRLRFLKEHFEKRILKPSQAVIIDVREFGIFVREENTLAEGLIHVSSLRDDFYIFDPERMRLTGRRIKRQFKLGDQIRVKVVEVDLYKKQINFELVR